MMKNGEQAPRFTLPDAEFRPFALRAVIGRPVMLAFFPAAFSPVCTRELDELQRRLPDLEAAGIQVAGISVDGPYALRAFAEQHSITFPLLSDFHRETIRAYGVEDPTFLGLQGVAKRALFLLDAEGIVRYTWVADRPYAEPDYDELFRVVREMTAGQASP
jgi:peroxiredoxin